MAQQRSYVGEVVRVRPTGELGVVVWDNFVAEHSYVKAEVILRFNDGRERNQQFTDLEIYPTGGDVLRFRTEMRKKYPGLQLL